MDSASFEKLQTAIQSISFGHKRKAKDNTKAKIRKVRNTIKGEYENETTLGIKCINLELSLDNCCPKKIDQRKLGSENNNYCITDNISSPDHRNTASLTKKPRALSPSIVSAPPSQKLKKNKIKKGVKFSTPERGKTLNNEKPTNSQSSKSVKAIEVKCLNRLCDSSSKENSKSNFCQERVQRMTNFESKLKEKRKFEQPDGCPHGPFEECPHTHEVSTWIEKEREQEMRNVRVSTRRCKGGISRPYYSNKKANEDLPLQTVRIRGRSILKQDNTNEWLKNILRQSFEQHGIGCRYHQAGTLPWYVQEDQLVNGPIYFGVLPGLYVGNFRDSKDQQQLQEHNITHILSIHDNARKLPCNNDKEYLCIIASDSPGQNLTQFFPLCNDFIHVARHKGGSVLIHCWRDALKAVQGARSIANPNVGFLKQIQEFEKERLHDERRRLKDKYGEVLREDDEIMIQELLSSYYHYMSVGEMCEGNCHPSTVCPRGLCHTSGSSSIFRCNSRENTLNGTSKSSGHLDPHSSGGPERPNIRTPSPTHSLSSTPRNLSTDTLTPPLSPCHQAQQSDEENTTESGSRSPHGPSLRDPTPAGTPSKPYGYYTQPSSKSPTCSFSESLNQVDSGASPSKTLNNSKVAHWPTPPPSPKRGRKDASQSPQKNANSFVEANVKKPLEETVSLPSKLEQDPSYSPSKSSNKQSLRKSITIKKVAGRFSLREAKSQDLDSSRESINSTLEPLLRTSTPVFQGTGKHESTSKFCQAVTRLLPKITALSSSSKLSTNEKRHKKHAAVLVDQDGRATLVQNNISDAIKVNDVKLNSTTTFNNDDTTTEIVFELCKNFRKLGKIENTSIEASFARTLDVSDYTNTSQTLSTNITANPIFALENKYLTDSLCNQPLKMGEGEETKCKAFLKDDIIYVETVERRATRSRVGTDEVWERRENQPSQDHRPIYGSPPPIPPRRDKIPASARDFYLPPIPPRKSKQIPPHPSTSLPPNSLQLSPQHDPLSWNVEKDLAQTKKYIQPCETPEL